MIFGTGQKILFIGDSITDCGRRDAAAPYGNGYMSLVRSFVIARYPELGLSFENRGVGGDTVRHLEARWQRDVIDRQPDWLSVKIGINDVWRSFGANAHEAVPIDEYEAIYRRLLRSAVDSTGCRLIIAEPYVIEPDRADPMRVRMDEYGQVARALALEFGAINVRTQEAFDIALVSTVPRDWADDRVHPTLPGHAVIAQAYLRAIGFDLGR
ncbi:MAG TPA: SGNH/GDSL hydrolase family protein [Thermomicrobiales bacterium]|nr:SGNH/GDSL hydrolase family protein [Thermomicrobiales bacterium]